jgi:hypothetical protein
MHRNRVIVVSCSMSGTSSVQLSLHWVISHSFKYSALIKKSASTLVMNATVGTLAILRWQIEVQG